MAYLKLKRRFEIFGILNSYQLYINDKESFKIGNNKEVQIDLSKLDRPNTMIYAKWNNFKSNEIVLSNLSENKQLEIYTFKYTNLFIGTILLLYIASTFLFEIPTEYYAYMVVTVMFILLLSHFVIKNTFIKLREI